MTLRTWGRVARATELDLRLYLAGTTAAYAPRDSVHLRHQELVLATAKPGGWTGVAESRLDPGADRGRSADIVLRRGLEWALCEVWDWFDDVGAAIRSWHRKLDRLGQIAIARLPVDAEAASLRVGGCWVVRATRRNRLLVAQHRLTFRSTLPGSGSQWLRALASEVPMPAEPALLWVSVSGDRLFPARF